MEYLFLGYENCSTCKSAENWLVKHGVKFLTRDLVKEPPNKEELKEWHKKSNLPLMKFFNTSGQVYRERNLKEKSKVMTTEELYDTLASNGMLVKRPLLVGDDFVVVGFKEDEYRKLL